MAKSKKKQTEESLYDHLASMGYDAKYLKDQIEEYMVYYGNLAKVNAMMLRTDIDPRVFTELSKEKRQITKEMRSILEFLGLRPNSKGIDPTGSDDDETL